MLTPCNLFPCIEPSKNAMSLFVFLSEWGQYFDWKPCICRTFLRVFNPTPSLQWCIRETETLKMELFFKRQKKLRKLLEVDPSICWTPAMHLLASHMRVSRVTHILMRVREVKLSAHYVGTYCSQCDVIWRATRQFDISISWVRIWIEARVMHTTISFHSLARALLLLYISPQLTIKLLCNCLTVQSFPALIYVRLAKNDRFKRQATTTAICNRFTASSNCNLQTLCNWQLTLKCIFAFL
jgi:hypothetical protein